MIPLLLVMCAPLVSCVDNGNVSPCASPTPVVAWAGVVSPTLAGYKLFFREPGGVWTFAADLPCILYDSDDDGVDDAQSCRGADFGAPLQRYCAACVPLNAYDFAVKAYTAAGGASADYSNVVSVCFSQVQVFP